MVYKLNIKIPKLIYLKIKVPNNFVPNINTKIPLYIYNKINYSISFTRSFKYL